MRCSEDDEVEEGAPGVQPANDLGEQRRHRQHFDLLPRRLRIEAEGGNGVGDHQPVERRIGDRLFGA